MILMFQIKSKLIELIKETGKTLHEPYVTTKHGKLRSKRKSCREPISAVDDLATLENLEEVNHEFYETCESVTFIVLVNSHQR